MRIKQCDVGDKWIGEGYMGFIGPAQLMYGT